MPVLRTAEGMQPLTYRSQQMMVPLNKPGATLRGMIDSRTEFTSAEIGQTIGSSAFDQRMSTD